MEKEWYQSLLLTPNHAIFSVGVVEHGSPGKTLPLLT